MGPPVAVGPQPQATAQRIMGHAGCAGVSSRVGTARCPSSCSASRSCLCLRCAGLAGPMSALSRVLRPTPPHPELLSSRLQTNWPWAQLLWAALSCSHHLSKKLLEPAPVHPGDGGLPAQGRALGVWEVGRRPAGRSGGAGGQGACGCRRSRTCIAAAGQRTEPPSTRPSLLRPLLSPCVHSGLWLLVRARAGVLGAPHGLERAFPQVRRHAPGECLGGGACGGRLGRCLGGVS